MQPLWKLLWQFLRKLDIVPEDTVIPLLGINPKDAPTYNKNTCSTMFIAALFIIARSWKEPRCPSADEWIQKLWYIFTMETTQVSGLKRYKNIDIIPFILTDHHQRRLVFRNNNKQKHETKQNKTKI